MLKSSRGLNLRSAWVLLKRLHWWLKMPASPALLLSRKALRMMCKDDLATRSDLWCCLCCHQAPIHGKARCRGMTRLLCWLLRGRARCCRPGCTPATILFVCTSQVCTSCSCKEAGLLCRPGLASPDYPALHGLLPLPGTAPSPHSTPHLHAALSHRASMSTAVRTAAHE